ncbi:MAG: hypothetical protein KDD47_23490 [Acidobacteria bacterium]|nr:hypothetical protein [Acidobacteriota bacterium]
MKNTEGRLGKTLLRGLAGLGLLLSVSACATQRGPATVPVSRLAYNQAVARSWDEQLLLNLVRMRYRDTPLFVDVGSITTQFAVTGEVALSLGATGGDSSGTSAGAGLGLTYEERPTVTYTPLKGAEFLERLLAPITPATLVLLSQSGWSIERLFICCVQEINGLRNAVSAAGPTPDYVPNYEAFHRMAFQLRALQRAELLRVEPDDSGNLIFEIPTDAPPPLAEAAEEARSLLGVAAGASELRTVPSRRKRKQDELAITGRSLLAVLFFLSQAVDVPPEHEAAGLVTVTRNADGSPFDWDKVTDRLLEIHTSERPPERAAVTIPYRGYYFWVADDDLTSKSTLNLVSFLFALKAGSQEGKEPLLTLGVN